VTIQSITSQWHEIGRTATHVTVTGFGVNNPTDTSIQARMLRTDGTVLVHFWVIPQTPSSWFEPFDERKRFTWMAGLGNDIMVLDDPLILQASIPTNCEIQYTNGPFQEIK
jgi:hypothetical protein